ncbi:cobalamin biosynthesis protein CbiM [Rhodoblastus acidophilus]|uniref:Cobalamin biosynthesis protein CbiM n=1 Tax=Rhodoblastus acidophilus TaxID=1074 RepID=A0A6N8DMH6_RHOAC|nr:cobalamin biosynthesis protein CbiM [Rhodoblastus acidophilus]MCW2274473.1 nickel transport protein [Rhodoblastus acidophilus]MTV31076.1 cobalamin biosynthesis protein CbiM [Rhodoblastus acidophilus]
MSRRLAVALLIALSPATASAHRLKVFVTAENGALGGYAFFVGGGRPEGADFVVKDGGREVFRGKTDAHGGFAWRPEAPGDFSVTVDAGDGHWAEAVITADRLGGVAPPTVANATPLAQPAPVCAPNDPDSLAKLVEAQVDRAVARQVRPLLEAYALAEARVRFNDVMGGVGMIVGLAGAGFWALSRRRRDAPE